MVGGEGGGGKLFEASLPDNFVSPVTDNLLFLN